MPEGFTLYQVWLLAVSLIAIGLIGKITEDVVTRESTRFDDVVPGWIASLQFPAVHGLMRLANALGSGAVIVTLTLVAIVWRWRRRDRDAALIMVALAIVVQVIDAIVKLGVHRVRPQPLHAYTRLYLASFPSGHAMNAVATYGFIAILLAHEFRRMRGTLFAFVAIVSLLIGIARVYLRLHWPTDVLGGYCVGLLLLSIAVFWLDRLEPERSAVEAN